MENCCAILYIRAALTAWVFANLLATEISDREIAHRSAQRICNQDGEVSYIGRQVLPDVIGFAMWLSYRFLLNLRMLEE
ncbi:hypothetical protein PQR66_38640 [Paraburkholderia agricolaris]|uniref:Uncharacterized protein n=1 Tax=Paraburkholderia agricolaris TaxID=2152888 RepID=A0ABW9A3R2_9BURK